MKNVIIVTLAAVGLAACTSKPTQEYRNPSSFGDSVSTISGAAWDLSGNVINASINSSEVLWDSSKKIATSKHIFRTSADSVSDLSAIGWGVSQDSSAFVIVSKDEVSKAFAPSVGYVVTTSGHIFEAALDASRTAIGVSVDLAKGSKDAIVRVGDFVVGSVQVSTDAIQDAALWTSEKSGKAARWSLDKSGELKTASGRIIGHVVDESGKVVSFVLDKSRKILLTSKDVSVAVIHGSSHSFKQLASDVRDALTTSKDVSVDSVKWSANKTVVTFKFSIRGSVRVYTFITNSLKKLLHSETEQRAGTTPASGAGTSGTSGY